MKIQILALALLVSTQTFADEGRLAKQISRQMSLMQNLSLQIEKLDLEKSAGPVIGVESHFGDVSFSYIEHRERTQKYFNCVGQLPNRAGQKTFTEARGPQFCLSYSDEHQSWMANMSKILVQDERAEMALQLSEVLSQDVAAQIIKNLDLKDSDSRLNSIQVEAYSYDAQKSRSVFNVSLSISRSSGLLGSKPRYHTGVISYEAGRGAKLENMRCSLGVGREAKAANCN